MSVQCGCTTGQTPSDLVTELHGCEGAKDVSTPSINVIGIARYAITTQSLSNVCKQFFSQAVTIEFKFRVRQAVHKFLLCPLGCFAHLHDRDQRSEPTSASRLRRFVFRLPSANEPSQAAKVFDQCSRGRADSPEVVLSRDGGVELPGLTTRLTQSLLLLSDAFVAVVALAALRIQGARLFRAPAEFGNR